MEWEYLSNVERHLLSMMGTEAFEYDFVVCSQLGDDNCPTYTGNKPRSRRVLIWLSDETSASPLSLTPTYAAIFKAYLLREHRDQGIWSFPLGYASGVPEFESLPAIDRQITVCFCGCPQPNRLEFGEILLQLASEARNSEIKDVAALRLTLASHPRAAVDLSYAIPNSFLLITPRFGAGLDHRSYGAMLSNSKIALCPGGWLSQETFRHFEAMRAGCVLVSAPLPETRLYKQSPIVYLHSWKELMPTINRLLSNPRLLSDLQAETVAWWKEVCSEEAQAVYISETLSERQHRSR